MDIWNEFRRNNPHHIISTIYGFLKFSYTYKVWNSFNFNNSDVAKFIKEHKIENAPDREITLKTYQTEKETYKHRGYVSDSTFEIIEAIYNWGIKELGWELT